MIDAKMTPDERRRQLRTEHAPLWALVKRFDDRSEQFRRQARQLHGDGKLESYAHGEAIGSMTQLRNAASELADVLTHMND